MTAFHSPIFAEDDDFDWEPPSEAEMKVIQARRERQDKISKLMGDYLLKGYKMLGECCEQCGVRKQPVPASSSLRLCFEKQRHS